MAIYIGNSGSVGGTGALTVDNDHIFADATERDAYFVSNPSELVEDLYVSTGGTLEKYVGSSWVDMSALIKGSTGAAGESAYEIAVDNGFVGTEAEWLESLKGAGVENAMTTPIYDPQGIASDVFDRSSQTGTQPINTISGLQTDLDSRALGSDLTSLEGTVTTLSSVVASKADQTDVDVLDAEVDSLTLTVGNKLDSSEYTATDIKSKYESNVNTNAFTDAEKTKLAAIVDGGGSNVQSDWDATSGDAEILNKPTLGTMSTVDDSPSDGTAYIREDGSWVLCDISKVNGLQAELSSLEQGTTDLTTVVGTKASDADLTVVEGNVTTLTASVSAKLDASLYTDLDVKVKYESNLDTNAFTDAYETKLNNLTDRFKGVFADAITRDASVLTPANGDYCKQEDTGSFWFYGLGVWVDTGSSSTGDMIASIYDPQGIAQDTFDRSNHTGTQAISTVTGLQADLDTRALESDLTLVENDVSTLSTSVSGKLDAVNYTSADVKTKYESNLDTNAFTDAEQTKLAGIENGAEANVGEEYTLTEKTKLGLIESGAQVNVGEEYTLAEKTKLATVSTGAQVNTVVAGSNITVDNTDPLHPVINSTATAGAEWGSITGTLSTQADLVAELATKQDGNTVLDNTTASFTTELATEIASLTTGLSTTTTDVSTALKAYEAGFGNVTLGNNTYDAGYPLSNANNITQVYARTTTDNGVVAYAPSLHWGLGAVWGRLRINPATGNRQAWVQGGNSSSGTGWTEELYHTGNMLNIGDSLSTAQEAIGVVNPNLIINGNFTVNQRGASNSDDLGFGQYGLDRWQVASQGLKAMGQVSSGNHYRCELIPDNSSDNYLVIMQKIEAASLNLIESGDDHVTASGWFWYNPSETNVMTHSFINVSYPTSLTADDWSAGSTGLGTVSEPLVYGWNYLSATFTASIAQQRAGLQLKVGFYNSNGTGSGNALNAISNIKLEVGQVATPFIPKTPADNLRECQRYYWSSGNLADWGISVAYAGTGSAWTNRIPLPVTMRGTPAVTVSTANPRIRISTGTVSAADAPSVSKESPIDFRVDITGTNVVPSSASFLGGTTTFTADAELY